MIVLRLYRWLVGLAAPRLSREYGCAMEETLARRLTDARRMGRVRAWAVWCRELAGLVRLAATERWSAVARERRRRERASSRWRANPMDAVILELRHAARRLATTPVFTIAAALTMALAIGATTAIFAVVERVVIAPLPFPASDRLIKVTHRVPRVTSTTGFESMPIGLYFHYAERARSLDAIAAYQRTEATLTGAGDPERIRVVNATASLSAVTLVAPDLGRWFSDAEGEPGAVRTVVLSHGFWQRRFAGDPAIVGRSIQLDGEPTVIVGVMPRAFAFPDARVDLWRVEQIRRTAGFGLFSYNAAARLRGDATLESAREEMTQLIAALPQAYPESPLAVSLAEEKMISLAVTLKDATIGGVARALWTLLAAVVVVLLVASANVANLCLVRCDARQREIAVRRALGAGRGAVARFFLAESLLLAALSGLAGAGLAWAAVRLLVRTGPTTLPRLEEIQLDASSLLFSAMVTLAAGFAFGVIPLVRGHGWRLHEYGRGNTASRQRQHGRRVLIAAQVALATVLLIASGLMVRSFQQLREVDPGYRADSALTFRVGLPARDYRTRKSALAAHDRVLHALRALPGVSAVSTASCLPLSGLCFGNTVVAEARPDEQRPGARAVVIFRAVASDFIETMGMRVLRGRGLTRDDVDMRRPHVVVNQAFADTYYPQVDPIGRRIASSRPPSLGSPTWLTIVGVVSNTPSNSLAEPAPQMQLMMPMTIAGGPDIPASLLVGPNVAVMNYVVRTAVPPHDIAPLVRHALHGIDAALAIAEVKTLQETLDQSAAQMAFTMILLAVAATVALLLGVVGIYGVMSYIVSQRTAEIGVRLALGAEPQGVTRAILRQGSLMIAAGMGVGLAAAIAGGRLIEALLYDVSPRDPVVVAASTIPLLLVALVACWLPARRAAQLSPVDALRSD